MARKHLNVMNTDQSFFFGAVHRKLNLIMRAHITASNFVHNILLTVKPCGDGSMLFDLHMVPN